MKKLLVLLAFGVGISAKASELVFSAEYPLGIGLALKKLELEPIGLAGVDLEANLSSKLVGLGLGYSFELGPAGRIALQSTFSARWSAGLRVALDGQAVLGPIALELNGKLWSNKLAEFDPLTIKEPLPNSENGYLIGLKGTYRLARTSSLRLEPQLSSENFQIGASWIERMPEMTVSAGFFTDLNYFGPTSSISWTPEDLFFTVYGQTFLGLGAKGFNYGLNSSINFSLFDDYLKLGLFAAYEPWRQKANILRFGLESQYDFESSQLLADLALGYDGFITNFAARISYLIQVSF